MILIFLLVVICTTIEGADICNHRDTTYPTGDVSSPRYPNNYPLSQNCSFSIRVAVGQSIVISFRAMNLEANEDENECYDYVEITDLITKDVVRHCGTKLPEDFTSKSNRVKLTFISDFSDPDPKPTGFRLTYRTITNIRGISVCPGSEFIGSKDGGYISSPNYPFNYNNNMNCKFTLLVPSGKKTHIEFVEMKIEYDRSCAKDRLNISSTVETRVICGEGYPKGSAFHGDKVFFHFISNARTTKKGFVIKYSFSDDETYKDDCVCSRGNSFIRVDLTKKKLIRHTDDIRFEFKTVQSNSLLLYAMGRHRDFLRVKLVQGQLKFSVDLGTGKGTITVPTRALNDNRWHFVEVRRSGRRARVTVDRSVVGIVETPGIFTKLDLRAPNAYMYIAGTARQRHGSNFVGCLRNFVIDNRKPIVDALHGDPAHTMYFNPLSRCPAA